MCVCACVSVCLLTVESLPSGASSETSLSRLALDARGATFSLHHDGGRGDPRVSWLTWGGERRMEGKRERGGDGEEGGERVGGVSTGTLALVESNVPKVAVLTGLSRVSAVSRAAVRSGGARLPLRAWVRRGGETRRECSPGHTCAGHSHTHTLSHTHSHTHIHTHTHLGIRGRQEDQRLPSDRWDQEYQKHPGHMTQVTSS